MLTAALMAVAGVAGYAIHDMLHAEAMEAEARLMATENRLRTALALDETKLRQNVTHILAAIRVKI